VARYQKELIVNESDSKLLEQDRKLMQDYRNARDALLQLSRQHKTQEAEQAIFNGPMRTTAALSKNLSDHMQFNYQLAATLSDDNARAYKQAITMSIAIILACLLVCHPGWTPVQPHQEQPAGNT
jgi:methyl-accepting chemotaxis protein